MFRGREKELSELNRLYTQNNFQLFILYGRRRVGKTTLLKEFCKGKPHIFYSGELSNNKLNLEKFSAQIFQYYNEKNLECLGRMIEEKADWKTGYQEALGYLGGII